MVAFGVRFAHPHSRLPAWPGLVCAAPGRVVVSTKHLAAWRPIRSAHATHILDTWNPATCHHDTWHPAAWQLATWHLVTWGLATWHGDRWELGELSPSCPWRRQVASRHVANRRVANRHGRAGPAGSVTSATKWCALPLGLTRGVFPRSGIRPLLVIFGHFWSFLVIFGHFWSFLPRGLGFAAQYGGLWGAICASSQPPACLARPCLRSPGLCVVVSTKHLATWRPVRSAHATQILDAWNPA